MFTKDEYSFPVSENSDVGQVVGVVLAMDPDLNRRVKYEILGSTAYNNLNNRVNVSQVREHNSINKISVFYDLLRFAVLCSLNQFLASLIENDCY